MKSIGRLFRHFFYDLWIGLPGWVVFFSIFWLVSVFSVSTDIASALFLGAGTALVLLATNTFFSWASTASYFQSGAPTSLRYFLPVLRGILYLLCASLIVPFYELLLRLVVPEAYQRFQDITPFIPVACLILSQFGSLPHRHPVRESVIDSLSTGTGFLVYLLFLGVITQRLVQYEKSPFYGAVLGGILLGMIAYLGREKQKRNTNAHE
ncbi:Rnf-Nqr domain containing protein [Desulfoluna sp.]|uniref:Rnf-Nqr domain containing protein n=1 Tax=Desulfoluna sp. TaxID=2045199 RepID=UPI002608DE67|nr:Rnf-Nqr domain containing protein [Desulfoluna sp.]